MHELRKDLLLSRWSVILERSLKPSEYPAMSSLPSAEAARFPSSNSVIEQGQNGVKVIKGRPLLAGGGELGRKGEGIYDKMNPIGAHEIVLEAAEGHAEGPAVNSRQFGAVLDIYLKRFRALIQDPRIRYVFIFKDKWSSPAALAAGKEKDKALRPGPYSEILATAVIPDFIKRELDGAKHYYEYKERCIFCDIINEEKRVGSRVLAETGHFLAFCPYAPRVPFEFWIVPKRHSCAFEETGPQELEDLARLLPELIGKMSRALGGPAYNYCIHTAPNRIPRRNLWHTLGDDYHWHIEVLPRLQRMSALDLGAGFHLITTSPEDAARYMKEA